MVFGSYEYCNKQGIRKLFTKIFGTTDYHSHIRLKPIVKYFRQINNERNCLEIGCGVGQVAFELNRRNLLDSYIGVDMNNEYINRAITIKNKMHYKNIQFVQQDAFSFLDSMSTKNKNFNYIILYDFIEHILEPDIFLNNLLKSLGDNFKGAFIVSVPTHNYPKIFGQKFHKQIGHLVDGYNKRELDELFYKLNFKNVYYEYNTGLIGNIGAYFYYHKYMQIPSWILALLTLPFRIIDINMPSVSSSLFCVYKSFTDC